MYTLRKQHGIHVVTEDKTGKDVLLVNQKPEVIPTDGGSFLVIKLPGEHHEGRLFIPELKNLL